MKTFLIAFSVVLLTSGVLHASDEIYDPFKGSFGMYDMSAEMAVVNKIESMTDPGTEKVVIGGLALEFKYIENELAQENGMQVAYVHFTDKQDAYILTYHVDGNKVVKIILFSKNNNFINKELFPAKNPDKKETFPEGKKQTK